MTQVAYGQKGYLGSSMSVRAVEAYEQGEMPISRWTKTAIIQAVKDYCFDFDLAYNPDIEKKTKAELAKEFLEYKSWHHSSRTAREVEFFGLNEDAVCRSFEQMSEEQIIERDRQMADERAALEARLQFMQSREKEFKQKFGCNPSSVVSKWKVYAKLGMPGWYSLVPIFSDRKLYENVRGNKENKTLVMAYLIISLLTIAQLATIIIFLNNLVQIFV